MHGAFPKIERWSSRSHIRERTLRLQDCDLLPSAFGIALRSAFGIALQLIGLA
ncbi:MAG: hypothetical protein IM466_03255 [Microcystis sp. M04BS1]|nr:hypothetical protein [Microcystis sp. M04BS1]